MVLDLRYQVFMVGEDQVGTAGDEGDPVIGLNVEDSGHVYIEAAESRNDSALRSCPLAAVENDEATVNARGSRRLSPRTRITLTFSKSTLGKVYRNVQDQLMSERPRALKAL